MPKKIDLLYEESFSKFARRIGVPSSWKSELKKEILLRLNFHYLQKHLKTNVSFEKFIKYIINHGNLEFKTIISQYLNGATYDAYRLENRKYYETVRKKISINPNKNNIESQKIDCIKAPLYNFFFEHINSEIFNQVSSNYCDNFSILLAVVDDSWNKLNFEEFNYVLDKYNANVFFWNQLDYEAYFELLPLLKTTVNEKDKKINIDKYVNGARAYKEQLAFAVQSMFRKICSIQFIGIICNFLDKIKQDNPSIDNYSLSRVISDNFFLRDLHSTELAIFLLKTYVENIYNKQNQNWEKEDKLHFDEIKDFYYNSTTVTDTIVLFEQSWVERLFYLDNALNEMVEYITNVIEDDEETLLSSIMNDLPDYTKITVNALETFCIVKETYCIIKAIINELQQEYNNPEKFFSFFFKKAVPESEVFMNPRSTITDTIIQIINGR